jgi:tetratricopeptide (TPR) repeat protein
MAFFGNFALANRPPKPFFGRGGQACRIISAYEMGRHQEAVEAYREAVRFKPDFAMAWVGLGFAYFISGNRSAALEAVKELRRYNPQKADELFNLIMKP